MSTSIQTLAKISFSSFLAAELKVNSSFAMPSSMLLRTQLHPWTRACSMFDATTYPFVLQYVTVFLTEIAPYWPFLIAAGAAGSIDAMGGGGGLITVPALLSVGIPAPLLLGTNKITACFGSLPAVIRFTRAGLVTKSDARSLLPSLLTIAICATGGAILSVSAIVLEQLPLAVPVLIGLVMAFLIRRWFFSKPPPRTLDRKDNLLARESINQSKLSPPKRLTLFLIGAYDGLFGPGTGSFFLSVWEGAGLRTLNANALTKFCNLASNLGALVWFVAQGKVLWSIGLAGATCYCIGNALGAGLVLQRGEAVVRICTLTATSLLLIKFIWTEL